MPLKISQTLVHELRHAFQERQAEMVALMRAVVETESPSGDAAGSREVVGLLAHASEKLSCVDSVERIEVPNMGEHLVVRAFADRVRFGHTMLVGHTDTVHARGAVAANPWRQEGNRLFGPGIFDMKANCVLAIEALRALEMVQLTPECAV